MQPTHTISLSNQGNQQLLTIPHEFALDATEVLIHKEGDRLIIEPVRPNSLIALLMTLNDIEDDFPTDLDEGLLPLDDIVF